MQDYLSAGGGSAPMNSFILALTILAAGSLLALLLRRSAPATLVATLSVVVAAGLAIRVALQVLLSGESLAASSPWSLPGGEFRLLLDPLAAFFVLPIAVLALLCALYAGPYLRHDGLSRSLAPHWFLFNLMVAAMLLVVTAANAILFLVAWEIMTVTSFFLVAWDHRQARVREAAWLYLLAAHSGMMLLLALFVLAGQYCGGLNFSDFGPLGQLPLGSASLLFGLALFGFGIKAGLFPVHIWLPNAHPAAPSHVSALMSGVLIKTGIYGILRILSLLPPAPAWWGWVLIALGGGGAFYGIALALLQRDIKRCLAYSTVENIGIILLALGGGIVAGAAGLPAVALLAYSGALLHIWNHALFKGLLFLAAGALLHATGSRDMNRMGGLLRRMPLTGLLLIGGSLAISALPPFNGLVSEWLIYLGLWQAGAALDGFAALPLLLLIGLLGVIGALALVTFVRLVGICLLGEARDPCAAQAREAEPLMLLAMGLLCAGCLWIGLLPQTALSLLSKVPAQLARQPDSAPLAVPLSLFGSCGGVLLLALLLVFFLLHGLRRLRPPHSEPTWNCAFRFPTPRMSYTGEAFSELAFRRLLPRLLRPELQGGVVTGRFPPAGSFCQRALDPVLDRHWRPLFVWLADRCQKLRWLQQGQLSIYLLYMFVASALLLSWSLWTARGG